MPYTQNAIPITLLPHFTGNILIAKLSPVECSSFVFPNFLFLNTSAGSVVGRISTVCIEL
jgi:hypothetical protein